MLNYKSEAAALNATMCMGDWTDSSTQSMGVSDQLRYTGKKQPPPPTPLPYLNTRLLGPQILYGTVLQKRSDMLDELNAEKKNHTMNSPDTPGLSDGRRGGTWGLVFLTARRDRGQVGRAVSCIVAQKESKGWRGRKTDKMSVNVTSTSTARPQRQLRVQGTSWGTPHHCANHDFKLMLTYVELQKEDMQKLLIW